jgi:serine phosphatase RsbU (regulator of sigma subunit)
LRVEMLNRFFNPKNTENGYNRIIYDNSAIKLVIIALVIMVLSISFFSMYSYLVVKKAIVHKLKSQDLLYIVQSIASKIDTRIARAQETSLILAEDPFIKKWLEDGEKDDNLGRAIKRKITNINRHYDYSKTFIVSAITHHYWTKNGQLLDTVSQTDPDDSWFFDTIAARDRISLSIDYNNEYQDTFVFINVIIGNVNHPVGITGVGMNLHRISTEFKSYKFGKKSNLWLVDQKGRIYISEDIVQAGKHLADFVPPAIKNRVLRGDFGKKAVIDYRNQAGERYDLIAQPIPSTKWKLVFQIPRSESTKVMQSIEASTIMACIVIVVLITFIFYFIFHRIANPYKRAVQISQYLERTVAERTRELNEKTLELQDTNTKIMDSIGYAKLIQESILPFKEDLDRAFKDYFIIWRPRDLVGGDFYWLKRIKNNYVLVLGDCTGHGVPGALMTMAANSILNHTVDVENVTNPALILRIFNRIFKATINKKDSPKVVDEGLDMGICCFTEGGQLIYAGAKVSLYIKGVHGVDILPGDRKGVGYLNVEDDYDFTNTFRQIQEQDVFIMTTDGYLTQNGGARNISFGRKRFEQIIANYDLSDLSQAKQVFETELQQYMNGEAQRDDLTVVGFKL